MLDLETRVELEESKLARVGRVEPLDGTGRDVADELGETNGSLLHGLPSVSGAMVTGASSMIFW